jgi:hypothetical protein
MLERSWVLVSAAWVAAAATLAPVRAQDNVPRQRPNLDKQIDEALKELEPGKGNAKVPEADPAPPAPEPRRNPFAGRAPFAPFGGPHVFRDLESIQKQIEAMNRVFEHLDNPTKQGKAIEEMRKQLAELNRRNGGGQPGDPVELMLKQIDILNKLQNDRNADPAQLLLRQMLLMKEIGAAQQQLGARPPARLGVQLQEPGDILAEQLQLPAGKGLVLKDVLPGTVAAKAGLLKGDILLEWNGDVVPSDIPEFQRMVSATKGGEPIEVAFLRRGRRETIKGLVLPAQNAVRSAPRGLFDPLLP